MAASFFDHADRGEGTVDWSQAAWNWRDLAGHIWPDESMTARRARRKMMLRAAAGFQGFRAGKARPLRSHCGLNAVLLAVGVAGGETVSQIEDRSEHFLPSR